jgi:hypothetical protein
MKKLSKSEFLDLAKRKTKDIEIPEWNAIITIKSLSAKTALDCQKHFQAGETDKYTYALLANSIVDSDGEYVFTEDECAELDYSVIDRLILEVMDFNNMGQEAVKKAREELKNRLDGSASS